MMRSRMLLHYKGWCEIRISAILKICVATHLKNFRT